MSFEHVVWPLLQLVQAPGQCLRIMVVGASVFANGKIGAGGWLSTKNTKCLQFVGRNSCTFVGISKV